MQLRDVVQSRILLKHIVLAITQAILARFSSIWAQNVRISRVYHVSNRSRAQQVTIGLKRSGCVEIYSTYLKLLCYLATSAT